MTTALVNKPNNLIPIVFICADGYDRFHSVESKINYLVTHIGWIEKQAYDTYEEIIEAIKNNYYYIELKEYIREKYGSEILLSSILPERYINNDGEFDLCEFCYVNHQLMEKNFINTLIDIITYGAYIDYENSYYIEIDKDNITLRELFDIIFQDDVTIELGRD